MFVHSLVKLTERSQHGWRAPVELGDAAPQFISFVVPLGTDNEFLGEYTCEIARITSHGRSLEARKLVKAGSDSFVLELSNDKVWFHVRGVGRDERRLPYIGKLRHDDFQGMLTEIEPEDSSKLDSLCEEQSLFVVGCDPEKHYQDAKSEKSGTSIPAQAPPTPDAKGLVG